jgi:hypothetical protein
MLKFPRTRARVGGLGCHTAQHSTAQLSISQQARSAPDAWNGCLPPMISVLADRASDRASRRMLVRLWVRAESNFVPGTGAVILANPPVLRSRLSIISSLGVPFVPKLSSVCARERQSPILASALAGYRRREYSRKYGRSTPTVASTDRIAGQARVLFGHSLISFQ